MSKASASLRVLRGAAHAVREVRERRALLDGERLELAQLLRREYRSHVLLKRDAQLPEQHQVLRVDARVEPPLTLPRVRHVLRERLEQLSHRRRERLHCEEHEVAHELDEEQVGVLRGALVGRHAPADSLEVQSGQQVRQHRLQPRGRFKRVAQVERFVLAATRSQILVAPGAPPAQTTRTPRASVLRRSPVG